jgi:hypothetical protein
MSELAEKLPRNRCELFNLNPLDDPKSSPMQQLVRLSVSSSININPAFYLPPTLMEELMQSSVEMLASSPAEELFHPVPHFILQIPNKSDSMPTKVLVYHLADH